MTTLEQNFGKMLKFWSLESRSFSQVSVSKVMLSTASLVWTNTKIVSSPIASNIVQLQFLCIFKCFQNLQKTLIWYMQCFEKVWAIHKIKILISFEKLC